MKKIRETTEGENDQEPRRDRENQENAAPHLMRTRCSWGGGESKKPKGGRSNESLSLLQGKRQMGQAKKRSEPLYSTKKGN